MSKPKKAKAISDDTRCQILEAAWDLIARQGRTDVALAEIASQAGVSRQTIFYAFGNRAELLTAMVRHRDTQSDHVDRIRAAVQADTPTPDHLVQAVTAWLDYLPTIYPVGILLDAASLSDTAAADAWNDRMVGALLNGLRSLAGHIQARGGITSDATWLADEIWAQVHPTMWRRLVVECGWAPEAFRESRLRIVRAFVDAARPS